MSDPLPTDDHFYLHLGHMRNLRAINDMTPEILSALQALEAQCVPLQEMGLAIRLASKVQEAETMRRLLRAVGVSPNA